MMIVAAGFSDGIYAGIKKMAKKIPSRIRGVRPLALADLKDGSPSITGGGTDLLLVDDTLILKDPDQAFQFIDEIRETQQIQCIIAVSSPIGAAVEKLIRSGRVEFVTHPIDPLQFFARVRTLMQLKKAEHQKKEARQWFYQVVESMPVIFAEYEDGINVNYGNALGADIWGIPHSEVLNPPDRWIQSIHPDDKDRVVCKIKAIQKETLHIQYRIVRPDGQLRWIEDSFIPVFNDEGQRLKIFGFGRDITKRKIAEFSLQKSEAHLRLLLETAANFAIYRLSFEKGDPTRSRVIFVSPSIVDILGVADPSLEAWLDVFHPEDKKKLRENLAGRPVELKYETTVRIFHPVTREWRWIQIIANHTLDEDQHLNYSNGIMFDVTERIESSIALEEKEKELSTQAGKLEELNDAMTVLLNYREKEIENIKSNTLETMKKLVNPYLQDLYLSKLDKKQQTLLNIISSHLENVTSSFARSLSTWKARLSPTEIKVADLVRSGKTTKEISELLNVTANAVSFHRANIRSKLGIANERINLTSYLRTLEIDSFNKSLP